MSKVYSEQELHNTIKDNVSYIAEGLTKDVEDVTADEVIAYFSDSEEMQDVDAESEEFADDAKSSISGNWHKIENSKDEVERILQDVKEYF